jgi:steroid delta-isomerase-like uncharacterized protein
MSNSEEHKATVRACFQAGTAGNLDALDAIIDPDFVLHDPANPEEVRGIEGLKALIEAYREGLADMRVTVEHQLAEGDHVATRYTCRGTHQGNLMGLQATGREVTISSLVISRFRAGRIVEEWEISDVFGLLRQIGALPELVES